MSYMLNEIISPFFCKKKKNRMSMSEMDLMWMT